MEIEESFDPVQWYVVNQTGAMGSAAGRVTWKTAVHFCGLP